MVATQTETKPIPLRLTEYRCSCGKLIGKGDLKPGSKWMGFCERCKREVLIQAA
jgi:hypothetical protein